MERAEAVIDLDAVRHNVASLRARAPGSSFMAVVKADGYGHGMLPVARAARSAGADFLGVALPSEAEELRLGGDLGPVMCWLYPPTQDLTRCVSLAVDLSASAPDAVDQVEAAAVRADVPARLHLKVDTGLGRGGSMPADWPHLVAFALQAQRRGHVEVVGIWSHLASADQPDSGVTEQQVTVFEEAVGVAVDLGVEDPMRHLAASGGVLAHPDTGYDMVRCGIAVYGLSPGTELGASAELDLIPAMSVAAQVALVKSVPSGQGVSYGLRYRTSAPTRLALVPVGYADGLPRAGFGRLPMRVRGHTFPVAGTIAMDQVVLDVGELDVEPGDPVGLFGGPGAPSADDWAEACDTINYEIVTRLGTRIPRRYVGAGA